MELNEEIDGNEILQKFKQHLIDDLQNTFKLKGIIASKHIVDLTSSTPKKFSHHLIIDHPRLIFLNNYHIGRYVKCLCCKLKKQRDMTVTISRKALSTTSDQCKTSDDIIKGLFVDEGVYTKNRNFRMFLSSKFNKIACLRLAKDIPNVTEECIFLRSLVTFVCKNKDKHAAQDKYITFGLDDTVCSRITVADSKATLPPISSESHQNR